jgi:hypothetical protein
MPPRFPTLLLSILLLTTVGCAAPRPAPPPQWPATFSDRQIFFTHSMVVYARTGSAADRAAQQVEDLDREFKRRTSTDPTPGLIIVNDVDDSQVGSITLADLLPPDQKQEKLDVLGITLQELAFAMSLDLPKDQLSKQAGFSAAALKTIDWGVATPSDHRMQQFEDHLIDAGLKHAKLSFLQRMVLIPFMPLLHSVINDAMNAEQDTLLYQCLCNAQPGWSQDRRKKEADAYEAWRMGEAVKSLKAATQQVKSDAGK